MSSPISPGTHDDELQHEQPVAHFCTSTEPHDLNGSLAAVTVRYDEDMFARVGDEQEDLLLQPGFHDQAS